MILLSIISLIVVIPLLWGLLVVIAETFAWQSDKAVAKWLYSKLGRDTYEGGPLRSRTWSAFKRGYWSAFGLVLGLAMLGLVLWFIFRDGESEDEVYERGYEEGYNDGQYEVCRELDGIASNINDSLRSCRGF